jgi:hypothetical protein
MKGKSMDIQTLPDLAERRKQAGFKAAATRRARAAASTAVSVVMARPIEPAEIIPPDPRDARAKAIALFERQLDANNPDWHAAALALKGALLRSPAEPEAKPRAIGKRAPRALPAPALADYDVDAVKLRTASPILIVAYQDGKVVRVHCPSKEGKPLNVGRALRVANAFYRANLDVQKRYGVRRYTRALPVPAIVSVQCEDTGETWDADLCSRHTAADRNAVGSIRLLPAPKVTP